VHIDRHSKTMLNERWENGQPCHVPDFRGNGFSFSPLKRTKVHIDRYKVCWVTVNKLSIFELMKGPFNFQH
jgi:hypothetical protein